MSERDKLTDGPKDLYREVCQLRLENADLRKLRAEVEPVLLRIKAEGGHGYKVHDAVDAILDRHFGKEQGK